MKDKLVCVLFMQREQPACLLQEKKAVDIVGLLLLRNTFLLYTEELRKDGRTIYCVSVVWQLLPQLRILKYRSNTQQRDSQRNKPLSILFIIYFSNIYIPKNQVD